MARSRAYQRGRTRGRAESTGEQESIGYSRALSTQESESWANGRSRGSSEAWGTQKGGSRSVARGRQESTAQTVGESDATGKSWSQGWTESPTPILKVLPTSVHDLQKVTHMAAEMLCSLPTGVAVVRTISDGRVEHAIVRTPERAAASVSDEQYAEDLELIVPRSNAGMAMADALHAIDTREQDGDADRLHARIRNAQSLADRDEEIASILRHGAEGPQLFESIAAYNAFADEYGCAVTPAHPYWERDFHFGNKATLRIRGMTSTLISGPRDHEITHKVVYGGAQRMLLREDNVMR